MVGFIKVESPHSYMGECKTDRILRSVLALPVPSSPWDWTMSKDAGFLREENWEVRRASQWTMSKDAGFLREENWEVRRYG